MQKKKKKKKSRVIQKKQILPGNVSRAGPSLIEDLCARRSATSVEVKENIIKKECSKFQHKHWLLLLPFSSGFFSIFLLSNVMVETAFGREIEQEYFVVL